jgi:hypothetical protein
LFILVVTYLVFSSFIFKPITPAALSSNKKASFNAVGDLAVISIVIILSLGNVQAVPVLRP